MNRSGKSMTIHRILFFVSFRSFRSPTCSDLQERIIFIMEESNRVPSIEPSRKFMHAIVAGLRIGPNASLKALVSQNDRYDPVGWPLTKLVTRSLLKRVLF